MADPVVIRTMHEDDSAACRLILGEAGQQISASGLRKFLAMRPRLSVVAQVEGRVVGCALASFNGLSVFLQHLGVAHPGGGIGRQLIQAVEAGGADAGATEVMLLSTESSTGFYAALGYALTAAHVARKKLRAGPATEPPDYSLPEILAILAASPGTLRSMLSGLPEPWIRAVPAGESWSPFEIVGHLAHGEITDWMSRVRHILEFGDIEPFVPFDRAGRGGGPHDLGGLLDYFEKLRVENLEALRELDLNQDELELDGLHPVLGPVKMRHLLATWAVHDLSHIAQVSRVLAARYREHVGPWRSYLPILDR